MKLINKFFAILFLGSVALSSFAQSQLDQERVEKIEKMAVSEALSQVMSPLKMLLAENYANTLTCDFREGVIEDISRELLLDSIFVDTLTVKNDCTINAKFVSHTYMPELGSQVATFKMTHNKETGSFDFSCSISGASASIPSGC